MKKTRSGFRIRIVSNTATSIAVATTLLTSACMRTADHRWDATICHLHNEDLEEDVVRIGYGLMAYDEAMIIGQIVEFPNAKSWLGGGCMVFDTSPTHARIMYCETCRGNEDSWVAWRKANPLHLESQEDDFTYHGLTASKAAAIASNSLAEKLSAWSRYTTTTIAGPEGWIIRFSCMQPVESKINHLYARVTENGTHIYDSE